jgi:signal transduction histidine kinase
MSLRQKILFGIIAIYSLSLGVLAALLSLDLAARERLEQDRRRAEIEQKNRYITGLVQGLVSFKLQQLDEIDIRDLLEWDYWNLISDPVLLTMEEREEIFINPAGAPAAGRTLDSDWIRGMIERAIETRQTVEEGDYIAVYLEAGSGEGAERSKWGLAYKRPEGSALPFRPRVDARTVFILMVVGIPLITLVTYGLLTRVVIRPIEQLQEANRRVARGDYGAEIPSRRGSGRDEIDVLIESFNLMLRDVRDYHENLEERVREATEKIRTAERRLVVAQRLAATGKLAAGIAHEINNPLGGMINITRNLIQKEYDSEKRREYAELVLEGLERIQATVGKMLPLSVREVKPQIVDLGKVLRQARELVRYRTDRESVAVVEWIPDEELPVFGDPHELHQVYLNILLNALDAIREKRSGAEETARGAAEPSEEAGASTVPLAEDWAGEIRIVAERRAGIVLTRVDDNGCGMSEARIEDSFDLFYTTKEAGEGSGLGLSIVHNIVENHGGTISIRSRLGEGTSVEISFPSAGRS